MKKRFDHIAIILGLYVLFFIGLKASTFLRDNAFYAMLVGLAVYGLIYWRSSHRIEKLDVYLIGIIAVSLIGSRLIFTEVNQPTLVLRVTAVIAFVLLHVVLLIGPWSRFIPKLNRFYFNRRHLGVTVLLLGAIHAGIVLTNYFNDDFNAALQSIFIFYGVTATILMGWLALTSWDYLQLHLKKIWWKVIHILLFVFWGYNAYMMITLQSEPLKEHLLVLIGFVIFWLVVAPYSIIRKVMRTHVFGWKQLHVLVYVVYVALLFHVFLGVIKFSNVYLKVLFWFFVFLVFGSHAAGWIVKFIQDRKINSKIKNINKKITKNGTEFVGVVKSDELVEGKGTKTILNKQPIALFKNGKEVHAISNVCAHQKGPLFQGRFLNGTVECPWHYYMYDVKKGNYVGKQKLCIPVYDTEVKDGIVFVSVEPRNKENVKYPG